jgi:hypothetical protein
MRDWRKVEGIEYNPTRVPGILACYTSKRALTKAPMYICAYCGGKIKQIRADDGGYQGRRCINDNCYTLASMTGVREWHEQNGMYYY